MAALFPGTVSVTWWRWSHVWQSDWRSGPRCSGTRHPGMLYYLCLSPYSYPARPALHVKYM